MAGDKKIATGGNGRPPGEAYGYPREMGGMCQLL